MDYDRDAQGSMGDQSAGATPGGTSDDAGTRAGSFDRKFTQEELGGTGEVAAAEGSMAGIARAGIGGTLDSQRGRVATQLERLGDRLEERGRGMEQAGGVQRRASQVAVRASEALDTGADYLRSHDTQQMQEDLEKSIRERPLLSVGLALGAGFLLARLLRE